MSVLAEAISVVAPIPVLEERFPGGLAGYRSLVPNGQFCADEHLTRVGFMSPSDVARWVGILTEHGLEPVRGETENTWGTWTDYAVVDQFDGPTRPCPWIAFEKSADGYSFCWLAGTEPGALASPVGWTADSSRSMILNRPGPGGTLIMQSTGDAISKFIAGEPVFTPAVPPPEHEAGEAAPPQ